MILEDWKNIKDEKPKFNGIEGVGVLVYPKRGNFPSTCHYDGKFWFNQKDVTNEVEYWTYLPPKPPKQF